MTSWLLKTEPSCYSFSNLEKDKKTTWDGVSNNLALKYLRQMKKGERALIYHTGDEKQIVGVAEVITSSYPDPKLNDPKMMVVDLKPLTRLSKPVTLAQVKSNEKLADFLLVKISRLSVMPVTDKQWDILLAKN